VYRIGGLGAVPPTAPAFNRDWGAFKEGLRARGYNEGEQFVMKYRWTGAPLEQAPAVAAELVRRQVDLILVAGNSRIIPTKQATRTITIVMVGAIDPVEAGLVASLAHPGGNVTGLAFKAGPEIVGKQLELLKEALPTLRRVAVLLDPASSYRAQVQEALAAARLPGLTLQFYKVPHPTQFAGAFAAMMKARAQALLVLPLPFMYVHAKRIAVLAARSRLPAMHPFNRGG
jgi:putative ABC transport system substrate-binding protein